MKNKVRTLDFYGFDDDNTMAKHVTDDTKGAFVISRTKEIKNMKYVKVKEEEEAENQDKEEENNEDIITDSNG